MTTDAFHTGKEEAIAILPVLLFILLIGIIAGKEVIAWLLMKLYEIFIQRNPLSI